MAPRRWATAAAITGCSLVGAPIRWLESARVRAGEREREVEPIFIIGHWQSGHSPVHYLLAQDPRFAYVSTLHCAIPSAFQTLRPLIERVLTRRLPENRVADSLPIGINSPQGDDMALAGLSDLSFYYAYIFPRHAEVAFRRAVLLDGVSQRAVRRWQQTYRRFLRRVAVAVGRDRIIARNATNTGRIPQLLDVFPNARFIHVYRNPYDVFASTCGRMVNLTELWALQTWDETTVGEQTLSFYERVMRRYFETRDLIPADNLVEVRYENFERDPLNTMDSVYRTLQLGDFGEVREQVAAYAEANLGRHVSRTLPSTFDVDRINQRWGFAIDRLGYDRLT